MRKPQAPIERGRIRDMTLDGRGVAEIPGKAVFVDGAITGEEVSFLRRRRRRNLDEAQLVEVLEASADRVKPRCSWFGMCGGCALQHLSRTAQIRLKQNSLMETLSRIGGVEPLGLLEPIAGNAWAYRRRARLGVKYVAGKGRVLVGFREKFKPFIADMLGCETLVPELATLLEPLSQLIGSLSLRERIPQIEAGHAENGTWLVFRVLEEPNPEDLRCLAAFGKTHGVQVLLQPGGNSSIRTLTGVPPEPLCFQVGEPAMEIQFGPTDFIQVNDEVNKQLVELVLELAAPKADDHVLDLFCGLGNFSLPLARRADRVTGVEISREMVLGAAANAERNGLSNARFLAGDLSKPPSSPDWLEESVDLALLDPPRAGALEILAPLAKAKPRRIIYVSCHPATLARDAGTLVKEFGYGLSKAGLVDMFPQTAHAEAVAVFDRA